jgi:sterol desaturase/sphingolipid hydroxylase (fatty acid hydroxylase superfamily)
MPSFATTLSALLVFTAVFYVVESLPGKGRRRKVFRKEWLTDALWWLMTPLLTKQLVRLALALPVLVLAGMKVATLEAFQLRNYTGFGPLSLQPLWLQALEVHVLADFLGYWTHRWFHRGRWWPFHAVHHSTEELDWLGSVRVHPVNELVNKLAQVSPLLLVGFNPWVTLSTAPVLTIYALLLHANLNWDFGPLRGVIASPVFHRWHHSKDREAWDKNFAGLLPLWDRLFGTYHMPKGRWPDEFGINEPMPGHIAGQIWVPFVWERWKRRRADQAGREV